MEALVLSLLGGGEGSFGGNEGFRSQNREFLDDQLHSFLVLQKLLQRRLRGFAVGAGVIEELDDSDIAFWIAENQTVRVLQ